MRNNKIIHYFYDDVDIWDKGTATTFKICFASWKKYCPEYEIKLWHTQMPEFQTMLKQSKFLQIAYKNKLWALIADYIRHYALYQYGGIYLDTDVQLLKNFDDYLDKEFFCSIEGDILYGENIPESAVLGGVKGHWVFKAMLEIYNSDEIFRIDYPIDPVVLKKLLKDKLGFEIINYPAGLEDRIEKQYTENKDKEAVLLKDYTLYKAQRPFVDIQKGVTIYPSEYFCPNWDAFADKAFTDKTVAIHWNQSSWWQGRRVLLEIEAQRFKNPIKKFLYAKSDRLAKLFSFFILYKPLRHKIRHFIEHKLR